MSDGSHTLRFIEPIEFRVVAHLKVQYGSRAMRYLNELEYAGGILYANIFMKDLIVMIDVINGEVIGEIDISSLRQELHNNPTAEVSNGIAYNKQEGLFYLTGKN